MNTLGYFTDVLINLGAALVVTLAVELPCAALFGVRWRGLWVVALVNLITNPVMNLLLIITVGIVGLPPNTGLSVIPVAVAASGFVVPLVLEVAVVVAEWRLMVWAFQGTTGSSRKLLAMSITMNVASAFAGFIVFVLTLFLGWGLY